MDKASEIAKAMVMEFGMYPDVLPYSVKKGHFISQDLRNRIDVKVKSIIMERLEIVKGILNKQNHHLLTLGDKLMERETLSGEEVKQILGL